MSLVTYRHFCTSPELLRFYRPDSTVWSSGRIDPHEMREAVALSLRNEHYCHPDHQHRQRTARAFEGAASLQEMLLWAVGLSGKGRRVHGLSLRQGRIYVDAPAFENWQREVTAYQSPVPLLAAFRLDEACRQGLNFGDITGQGRQTSCVEQALLEDLRAVCLPGMHDPRLDELIRLEPASGDRHGRPEGAGRRAGRLIDAHVHINGSTEATAVWLHALTHPGRFCREIRKAVRESAKARFFLHQLQTSVREIYEELCRAAALREMICRLLEKRELAAADRKGEGLCWAAIAARLRHVDASRLPERHPWRRPGWTDLQAEGVFWLHALVALRQSSRSEPAILLHYYLLLMHQFFRLLVQHPDQFGFDQFQYITVDGGRDALENECPASFRQRFAQFCGMYGEELELLEARFSPKDSGEGNCRLLRSLWKGHQDAMRAERAAGRAPYDIVLVAHFIKKAEKEWHAGRRYFKLRDDVMRRSRALVDALQRLRSVDPALARRFVGKDAASNELETPPEVFAPAFRYLKRHGLHATTYHAGEDFTHVLCGMRAVYEAMRFLEMGSGDRIGHATAIGIDPEICCGETFTDILCQQGVWLDSLIWLTWMLYHHLMLAEQRQMIATFQPAIEKLYRDIYGSRCPELSVLWAAWKLRTLDPQMLDNARDVVPISNDTRSERQLWERLKKTIGTSVYPEAEKAFRRYHAREYRAAYDKSIRLPRHQQPSAELLRAVQDAVVQDLRDKRIAVEALPTSNVRISHYRWTKHHHLLRWLDPTNDRPAPFVLLGTDDPGIFATTIRNEMGLVLRRLNRMYPGRSEVPYEIVNHLIRNGRSYAFALAEEGKMR